MVNTHTIPTPRRHRIPFLAISPRNRPRTPQIRRLTVCNGLRTGPRAEWTPDVRSPVAPAGRWLQRAGFHIGVPVKVHVSRGRLVIEAAEPRSRPASRGTGEDRAGLRGRTLETRARCAHAALEARPDRLTPADQRPAVLRRRRPSDAADGCQAATDSLGKKSILNCC